MLRLKPCSEELKVFLQEQQRSLEGRDELKFWSSRLVRTSDWPSIKSSSSKSSSKSSPATSATNVGTGAAGIFRDLDLMVVFSRKAFPILFGENFLVWFPDFFPALRFKNHLYQKFFTLEDFSFDGRLNVTLGFG